METKVGSKKEEWERKGKRKTRTYQSQLKKKSIRGWAQFWLTARLAPAEREIQGKKKNRERNRNQRGIK